MGSANEENYTITDEMLEQYLLGACDNARSADIEQTLGTDTALAQRLEQRKEEIQTLQAALGNPSGEEVCADADLDLLAQYLDGSLPEATGQDLENRLELEAPLRRAFVSMYKDLQIVLDDAVPIPDFEIPKAGEQIDYKSMRDILLQNSERKAKEESRLRESLENAPEADRFQQGSS